MLPISSTVPTTALTTSPNVHLLLRIQQSNCYTNLSVIDFLHEQHYSQEINYLQTIINSMTTDNYVLAIDALIIPDPQLTAIESTLGHKIQTFHYAMLQSGSSNDLILMLSTENYQKLLSKILPTKFNITLYVLRHEGDFVLNPNVAVSCDCNHCLLTNLIPQNTLFKFNQIFPLSYRSGNCYSMLSYTSNNIATSNQQITDKHSVCKKSLQHMLPKMLLPIYSKKIPIPDPYQHFRSLGEPKYIAAPMVGQSELAFRMLLRKLGVHLCYTPMINAELFLTSQEYQQELFATTTYDRPLAVQFAGNDPEVILAAANKVAKYCDLIDINLGSPQPVARRHKYGSWLMEDPASIYKLLTTLKNTLNLPISCKIRIFESLEQTIQYSQMLEQAGCALLTIHGRTRKSNMNTEPADWQQIKAVKSCLTIPVIANGMIHSLEDAQACLKITSCDGVMVAGSLLENPYLFTGETVHPLHMATQYLKYAAKYQAPLNYAITHVIQITRKYLTIDLLKQISQSESLIELKNFINDLAPGDFKFNNNLNANPISLVAASCSNNFQQMTI